MFLTGEIIHNPHVNERLRANGIRFLSDPDERKIADLGWHIEMYVPLATLPTVAADIAALAALVDGQGRHDEAEQMYRRVLAVFERAFASVDPPLSSPPPSGDPTFDARASAKS